MKTFMFPGQGSQSKGMGENLFDEFKEFTEKADRILGYSIKELCLEDPDKKLGQTQFTQPALYVVNALSYYKKTGQSENKPDFVVGHSLGEFNALLAAECFDFEAGLKLVKKRGELMSQATGGGMAAILNATKEEIQAILIENGLTNIDLVNFNTPSQIVISGLKDEIVRAQPFFQKGKMIFHPLNTSGAFHSRFMHPAKEKFEVYLKKFKLSDLKIPVISNVTARPYQNDEILEKLASQISSPVKWCESIQYLMGLGDMEFEEVGHGQVLDNLVRKIQKEIPVSLGKDKQSKVSAEAVVEKDSQKQKNEMNNQEKVEVSEKEEVESLSAKEKVDAWNENHPVGTRVKSSTMEYDDLETRTEAVVLFGHRAAVYMKGYNGYFDLDEISPL